jgi:hypothetical protein
MTVAVIDGLEMVEIADQDGENAAVTVGASQFLAEAVAEVLPVEQAGQRVVHSLFFEKAACART